MTEPRQTTPPPGPDPTPPEGEGWNGHGWDWQQPYGPPGRSGLPDLSPIFAILEALRRMVPAELQDQFNALQREVLLTVKALIDWYLERLDARERPVQVEDIPID